MFNIRKIQEQVIFNAIKGVSNDKAAKEIVYGQDDLSSSEDNPAWVKSTMKRLEQKFDKTTVNQIRMNCQCGYGMDEKFELLNDLIKSSSNLEEFANQDKSKAAGLFYKDGKLYLQFLFCPCPMLAEVDKLDTDTWCQCTTGYSKVLFEKSFGCEVVVNLLKSIKMGDDICLQEILPLNSVWE